MRHLHDSGETHTLCGLGRSQADSVHVTKARKTDCGSCRNAHRARLRDLRVGAGQSHYDTRAERAEDGGL